MKIENDTSLTLGWLVTSLRPPELHATFVVKGTFRLKPGTEAEFLPVEECQFPTGDEYSEDDPEKSLYYPSDFAPAKKGADLLLVGTCYAPGGNVTRGCDVTFQVGAWTKRLAIIGDRVASPRWPMGYSVPEPQPFTQLKVSCENAFGGSDFPSNPLGKGYVKETLPDGTSILQMPNIQHADRLDLLTTSPIEPAFFGPVPSTWPQRKPVGTYDQQWLEQQWPWFPVDFDWRHFNAAPRDQQLEGCLRGDETVAVENMHPEVPYYTCRLPSLRPQIFISECSESGEAWRQIEPKLDTLWLDMDEEKLILVWRGHSMVQSLKMDEIAQIHVIEGNLQESPMSVDQYREVLARKAAEEKAAAEREAAEKRAQRELLEAEMAEMQKQIDEAEAEADKLRAEALEQLGERDFISTSPVLSTAEVLKFLNEERAKTAKTINPELAERLKLTEPIPDPGFEEYGPDWTRERCHSHAYAKGSFARCDLSGIDLSGLTLSSLDFTDADLTGCNLEGTDFNGADLTGADLRKVNLTSADLSSATLVACDLSQATLCKTQLQDANLDRATLRKANLENAMLERVSANFANFVEADLTNAVLRNGSFKRTDFTSAVLRAADFSEAVLSEALVEEARGAGVNMQGADLTDLHAGNAPDFTRGNFQQVKASGSYWEGACLDGADFRYATLNLADFTSASLVQASLGAAELKEAKFEDAKLESANLVYANVFRGSFERACLRNADLREANLYEVEFWDAVIDNANFQGANVKMTKLG